MTVKTIKSTAIESTYQDGRKVYRFIEGSGKASIKYANQLAGNFSRKNEVRETRVFVVDELEKSTLRGQATSNR